MFTGDIELVSFLPTIQITSLILLTLSFVFGILCIRKFKKLTLFIIPMLTYVAHAIVFYIFVLYSTYFAETPLDDMIINGWSSGIRLHQALLLLSYFIVIFFWGKKWKL